MSRYNGLSESAAEIATQYYRKVYVEKHITSSNYYKGAEEALMA